MWACSHCLFWQKWIEFYIEIAIYILPCIFFPVFTQKTTKLLRPVAPLQHFWPGTPGVGLTDHQFWVRIFCGFFVSTRLSSYDLSCWPPLGFGLLRFTMNLPWCDSSTILVIQRSSGNPYPRVPFRVLLHRNLFTLLLTSSPTLSF